MSKTQDALKLLDETGWSPYKVAREIGIATPTLYKAIKAREKKAHRQICPACGQPIKNT